MAAVRAESVNDLGDLGGWSILKDEPRFVSIIREIENPKLDRAGFVRTHEVVVIEDLDAPNVQGWFMTSAQACELRRNFGDLENATVTLDPAAPPQPGDRWVRLLVTETACASGEPATGRVQVPLLEPGDDAVRVAFGVTRREGNQNCPGNPATPFTLELPEPLGERPLIDAGVYPERELTPPRTRRAG